MHRHKLLVAINTIQSPVMGFDVRNHWSSTLQVAPFYIYITAPHHLVQIVSLVTWKSSKRDRELLNRRERDTAAEEGDAELLKRREMQSCGRGDAELLKWRERDVEHVKKRMNWLSKYNSHWHCFGHSRTKKFARRQSAKSSAAERESHG